MSYLDFKVSQTGLRIMSNEERRNHLLNIEHEIRELSLDNSRKVNKLKQLYSRIEKSMDSESIKVTDKAIIDYYRKVYNMNIDHTIREILEKVNSGDEIKDYVYKDGFYYVVRNGVIIAIEKEENR
jgi:predicted transcriptional regulator